MSTPHRGTKRKTSLPSSIKQSHHKTSQQQQKHHHKNNNNTSTLSHDSNHSNKKSKLSLSTKSTPSTSTTSSSTPTSTSKPAISSRSSVAVTAPISRRPIQVVDVTNQLDDIDVTFGVYHANGPRPVSPTPEPAPAIDESRRITNKQVAEFGATALHKRDRKLWLAQQEVKMGAKPLPNQRMPYKMLQGMRAKNIQRAERKSERDRLGGVVTSNTTIRSLVSGGRLKEEERDKGLLLNEGGRKDKKTGGVRISRRVIADVSKSSRPASLAKVFNRKR